MDINNLIVWVWTFCGLAGTALSEYLRVQYRIDGRVADLPAMDPMSPDIVAARRRLLWMLEPMTVIISVIGLFVLARIYRGVTPDVVERFADEWVTEVFRWGMLAVAILVFGAIAMLAFNSRDLIKKANALRRSRREEDTSAD